MPLSMPAPPEAVGFPAGPEPPAWAAVQQPRSAPSAWRAEALRPPGSTSGRLTILALAATVAASALLMVVAWPLTEAQTWFTDFDYDRVDSISTIGSLLSLVVAVVYLSWCYRITEGFAWLTGRMPRVGKVAIIGWWFVPLANLVMPAVALGGVFGGLTLPGRRRHGWLLPVWWIGFLLSRLLSSLWSAQLTVLAEDPTADAQAFASNISLLLAAEALSIVSALALIAIIVTIGRDAAVRQRAAIGMLPWPPPPDVR